MEKNFELSIILPTLNEAKNLKILIPNIIKYLNLIENIVYEIIVVDDGSTDNTREFLTNNNFGGKVSAIYRSGKKSLPMSIYEGIENSKYLNVSWLDADGSMPPEVLKEMILINIEKSSSVVIGSRFVEGGGYKGIKEFEKNSIFSAIKNVYRSNDSVFGMLASTLFNKFLLRILDVSIKDITSGFIIGKKEYFKKEIFQKADYGDYFIYLISDLSNLKIDIVEFGYVCETRIHGVSKTSTNVWQLIKRGIPYIKAANDSRKVKD